MVYGIWRAFFACAALEKSHGGLEETLSSLLAIIVAESLFEESGQVHPAASKTQLFTCRGARPVSDPHEPLLLFVERYTIPALEAERSSYEDRTENEALYDSRQDGRVRLEIL